MKKKKPKISPTEHKNHSMSPVQYLACNEGGNYMKEKMLNAPQLRTPLQPHSSKSIRDCFDCWDFKILF